MSRTEMVVELLEDFGFDPERFSLHWVSSAEPDKFVDAVTRMTAKIKQLGPVNSDDATRV
jgi:coenzyme F420-reducing hydrogenase delta subunit